jgi:hypothetical protein
MVVVVRLLIKGVISLSYQIDSASNAVMKFRKESLQLSKPCGRIRLHMDHLLKQANSSAAQDLELEGEIEQLHAVFEQVKTFLELLGNVRLMTKEINDKEYNKRFKDLRQEIDRAWNDFVTASNDHGSVTEEDESGSDDDPDVDFDFSTAPVPVHSFGSSLPSLSSSSSSSHSLSASSIIRADRKTLGSSSFPSLSSSSSSSHSLSATGIRWADRIEPLLRMDQSVTVTKFVVVGSKMEGNDSTLADSISFTILLYPYMINTIFEFTRRDALSMKSKVFADFRHFHLQIELSNGTCCILERCVDDVYLYHGESDRREQVPYFTTQNVSGVTLKDLIRLRNAERQRPYDLLTNNCKHFVFYALKLLLHQPYGLHMKWKSEVTKKMHEEIVNSVSRFAAICNTRSDIRGVIVV